MLNIRKLQASDVEFTLTPEEEYEVLSLILVTPKLTRSSYKTSASGASVAIRVGLVHNLRDRRVDAENGEQLPRPASTLDSQGLSRLLFVHRRSRLSPGRILRANVRRGIGKPEQENQHRRKSDKRTVSLVSRETVAKCKFAQSRRI